MHIRLGAQELKLLQHPLQISKSDYRMPYLVGFQYSREDETDAYTWGPDNSRETREYQHPHYRQGLASFKREFDYYFLGVWRES